jgi:hypothetical protein
MKTLEALMVKLIEAREELMKSEMEKASYLGGDTPFPAGGGTWGGNQWNIGKPNQAAIAATHAVGAKLDASTSMRNQTALRTPTKPNTTSGTKYFLGDDEGTHADAPGAKTMLARSEQLEFYKNGQWSLHTTDDDLKFKPTMRPNDVKAAKVGSPGKFEQKQAVVDTKKRLGSLNANLVSPDKKAV